MKLTEQQLAQLFKQGKTQGTDSTVDSLLISSDASDKRIKDVEKIADSNQLSASYQVINQLRGWSNTISQDFNKQLSNTNALSSLFSWLKPTLATAAIATVVYFAVPNMNLPIDPIQQAKPNQMMFSGSFEKGKQHVLPAKHKVKSDIIYRGDFG